MSGSGRVVTCGESTQNVPPASSLPGQASSSAPAGEPKVCPCRAVRGEASSLQRLCLKDEVRHGFLQGWVYCSAFLSRRLCLITFFHRTCGNIIAWRPIPRPSPVVRTGNKFSSLDWEGCKTNTGTNAFLSLQASSVLYSLFSRVKKYGGNHPHTSAKTTIKINSGAFHLFLFFFLFFLKSKPHLVNQACSLHHIFDGLY